MQDQAKGVNCISDKFSITFIRSCGKQGAKSVSLMLLLVFFLIPIGIPQALCATLTVQLPGSGTGSVNSSPSGMTCPGACSGDFTSVTLSANPNGDSVFSGWGGACAGMENCTLTLSGATTVTAVFTLKSSPVHVGGSYYGALQKAYETVPEGGVVMAVAQDQPGDLNLNKGIGFTIKGGYDAGFSSNAGNVTNINGTVSLATGNMTVENLAIGQSLSSTPTAPPTGLTASPGSGQVSLSWGNVLGATSYNVYYSTTMGVTRESLSKVTGISGTSQTVTGLTNSTTYYFVVTTVGASGESIESAQVIVTPVQAAPAAPTGVSATAGNGQVSVSWAPVTGATSYNIYYNTSSSGSTKITGATNPKVISLANNSTYWFVVTAVGTGGESAQSSPAVPATPVVPPVSDLVGTWNFMRFAAGPGVTNGTEHGWVRGNATIAANGAVTVNSILKSSGSTTPPPVGAMSWTMDAVSGVVTQVGDNALDSGNHGVMAANKQVIVGNGSIDSDRAIYVCVKQVGVSFSNADLTNKPFVYHQLFSGANNEWQYGAGNVDNLLQVVLTSMTDPSGTTPNPGIVDTLTLNSQGIMTSTQVTGNQEWGIMTPDKRNIFAIQSESDNLGTSFVFRIIQLTGQTFTQPDLAGIWRDHTLVSSLSEPFWEYDLDSVTNAGVGSHLATIDSTGNTIPSTKTSTLTLGTTVTITRSDKPYRHGQVSFNKDMLVMTGTSGTDLYSLSIGLKQ